MAHPSPLAQLLGLRHRQQAHIVLCAQGLHQLLVIGLVAVLCQHTQLGLQSSSSSQPGREACDTSRNKREGREIPQAEKISLALENRHTQELL